MGWQDFFSFGDTLGGFGSPQVMGESSSPFGEDAQAFNSVLDEQTKAQIAQPEKAGGSIMFKILSGALLGLGSAAGAPDPGTAFAQGYQAIEQKREKERQMIIEDRRIKQQEKMQEAQTAMLITQKLKLEKEIGQMDEQQQIEASKAMAYEYATLAQAGLKPFATIEPDEESRVNFINTHGNLNFVPVPLPDGKIGMFKSDDLVGSDAIIPMYNPKTGQWDGEYTIPAGSMTVKDYSAALMKQYEVMSGHQLSQKNIEMDYKASMAGTNTQYQVGMAGVKQREVADAAQTAAYKEVGMANATNNGVQKADPNSNAVIDREATHRRIQELDKVINSEFGTNSQTKNNAKQERAGLIQALYPVNYVTPNGNKIVQYTADGMAIIQMKDGSRRSLPIASLVLQ